MSKDKIILETHRLKLMEASLDDAPFFFRLLNSPGWKEFIGDFKIGSLDEASNYIQKALLQHYENHGYGLYIMVVKEKEEAIGLAGLINRPSLEFPDIGFAILPEFEGQGYTFEACSELMEFGKDHFGMDPIYAITSETNLKSLSLLDKLGMKLKGKTKLTGKSEELMLYTT